VGVLDQRCPFPSRYTAQLVRLLMFHHVPEDRRQPAHDHHPRDLRPAPSLDPLVPLLHRRIAPQDMQHHLRQDEPRQPAPLLGDRAL